MVGYDDSAFMNCTEPPLTTVRQPIEAMGRAAVELLVTQIQGGSVTPEELLFEPELVVRGSTAQGSVRHRAEVVSQLFCGVCADISAGTSFVRWYRVCTRPRLRGIAGQRLPAVESSAVRPSMLMPEGDHR